MEKLVPLKLKQVTKQIIWGGTRLSGEYGLGNEDEQIAEANKRQAEAQARIDAVKKN